MDIALAFCEKRHEDSLCAVDSPFLLILTFKPERTEEELSEQAYWFPTGCNPALYTEPHQKKIAG